MSEECKSCLFFEICKEILNVEQKISNSEKKIEY